jgi:hypothetical protein
VLISRGEFGLRYSRRHEAGGVLTLAMHPEAIGRRHRIAMLERVAEMAEAPDGEVFERLDHVVGRWASAHPRAEPEVPG